MMLPEWIATLALLAGGGALRVWCEAVEARHLRLSAMLLGEADNAAALEPTTVTTVLRRTRAVLGASKLARLASLLMLVPGATMAALLAETHLAAAIGPTLPPTVLRPLVVAAAALATFLLLFFMHMLAVQREGRRPQPRPQDDAPEWLLSEDVPPPALLVVAWALWESLGGTLDRLLGLVKLGRPSAQLVEQQSGVRLSVDAPVEIPTNAAQATDDDTERRMIRAIHDLDHTLVREVMRPINQVTAIRLRDTSPRRLLEMARRTGYTRFPCYEDVVTNLCGYINVYDLLNPPTLPTALAPLVVKPLLVPEVARLDQVLHQMIATKHQVAIVFDEFGGTSGWLSREDILEEIVGEVGDEFAHPTASIHRVGRDWLADPAVHVDDLERELGLELPKRAYDTLGGFIYYRLGRVPRRGEVLEEAGWKIHVAGMDEHRLRRVRLQPPVSLESLSSDAAPRPTFESSAPPPGP